MYISYNLNESLVSPLLRNYHYRLLHFAMITTPGMPSFTVCLKAIVETVLAHCLIIGLLFVVFQVRASRTCSGGGQRLTSDQ